MRILVTGGAGFIGSHVVDRYVADGHHVAIIDNLSTGFEENINPQAVFYKVDITDQQAVAEVFEKERPEIVNHHAAQMDVRRSVADPAFDAVTNIVGSIHLIENAVRTNVSKFIYASTGGAVYGEPRYLPADEDHPINPLSQYGISKHTVEHYLQLYQVNDGLTYTVLRYGNVYGPRQNPHGEAGVNAIFAGLMLAGKQPTIFGDGSKTRDYVYVSDVVEANVLALAKGDNDIFNIATGIQTTDQEVFEAIAAATGFTGRPIYGQERKGEIRHSALDITKARRKLGWEPKVPFAEGSRLTVEAVRAQRGGRKD